MKVVRKETSLECHRCRKKMCGTCCRGFQKAMLDTKFISKQFWNTDDIYKTMYGVNTSLHGFTEERMPCCESWDEVRTYNDVYFSKHHLSTDDLQFADPCIEQDKKKVKMSHISDIYTHPMECGKYSLDGALLFPSYHLLVPGYIGIPQTHIIGSQGDFDGEDGVPHAVIDSITAKSVDMVEFATHNKKLVKIRSTTDIVELPDINGLRREKRYN
ncbi:TPA: hypothetical protein EYO57_33865 [Candidatus Poribacteria bacterium]|nr:hypothetical protein [Candidatus Poribacteria bacterium]